MIEHADAVVIGSGALGASTAFHLLKAGLANVALLDQHAIGSQTSPRAAGLTQQVRDFELMTDLARRAVEKICHFEQDTGEALVLHQSGSLKIARTPEHARRASRRSGPWAASRHRYRSRDTGGGEAAYAVLQAGGRRGDLLRADDLYLEPDQIPLGYARAFGRLEGK